MTEKEYKETETVRESKYKYCVKTIYNEICTYSHYCALNQMSSEINYILCASNKGNSLAYDGRLNVKGIETWISNLSELKRLFRMIHLQYYCCEPLHWIENFEVAARDNFDGWECHHRLETTGPCFSQAVLQQKNMYTFCPAEDLIFLTKKEHIKVHTDYRNTKKSKVPETLNVEELF